MNDEQPILVAVPRISRGMKALSAVLSAIWLVEAVLVNTPHDALNGGVYGPLEALTLIPSRVLQGHQIWRLVTYAALHDPTSLLSILMTVFTLWWFGSTLERSWGMRRVGALLVAGGIVGGLLTTLAGILETPMMTAQTVGCSGPCLALIVAWGMVRAQESFSFLGMREVTGKQFALLMVVMSVVLTLVQRSGANVASLGGALAGYVMVKMTPHGGTTKATRRTSSPRLRAIDGGAKKKEWLN